MSNLPIEKVAGNALRVSIKKRYPSQQAFAEDYGTDLRNVSRWVNQGINDVRTIQELAIFFDMDFFSFLQLGI